MSAVIRTLDAPPRHWVGDGFPVSSLFSYQGLQQAISPFLLLDHAGPADFQPAEVPRGVGVHPHRGFETVTIVYDGAVAHRDSTGEAGVIGPGDVQWMTAASGILHAEFHSHDFTRTGGTLEMAQLWVNLPARVKMSDPRYQGIVNADIPTVPLAGGAGQLRVIAGDYEGHRGPAHTFSPINVWDLRLSAGHETALPFPTGHTAIVAVLAGTVDVGSSSHTKAGQTLLLDRTGGRVAVRASTDSKLLVLTGEPLEEPIAGHGPFVMNTRDEILQALTDFESGRFGRLERA